MAPFYSKFTQVRIKGTVLIGNVLKVSTTLNNLNYYMHLAYL